MQTKLAFTQRCIGIYDICLSVQRRWRNCPDRKTWRHFDLGLRSPVIYHPADRIRFNRPRFGIFWQYDRLYVYCGMVYLILELMRPWESRRRNPEYIRLGLIELAY